MSPVIRVVQEAGHWCAAVPLLACFIQQLRHRNPTPDAWLLSCAFFVSVIADSVMAITAASGNNWWIAYIYTPIQFALFVAVLTQARALRTVALAAILMLAIVSAARGTLGAPETVVQVLGGGLVGLMVLEQPRLGRYQSALLIYCWATIPFLIIMGATVPAIDGVWVWSWGIYQLVRVTAMVLMTIALVRQPVLRLLEDHGHGTGQTAGGWWGSVHLAQRDSDSPMAKTRRQAG